MSRYLSFFAFFHFYSVVRRDSIIYNFTSLLILFIITWSRISALLLFQNPREVSTSHSPVQTLGCAYTICSYSQTSISCTIPSWLLCRASRVYSHILSVLICCIRLLWDWSFRFYHHITNTCFVASYLFSLWYGWSLWRYFVLLLEEIHSLKVSLS